MPGKKYKNEAEKTAYFNFVGGLAKVLAEAGFVGKFYQTKKINDNILSGAEEGIQSLIDRGAFLVSGHTLPAGTTPYEAFSLLTGSPADKITFHIRITDHYIPLEMPADVSMEPQTVPGAEDDPITVTDVWSNFSRVQTMLIGFAAELKPSLWTADSGEFDRVRSSLEALNERLGSLDPMHPTAPDGTPLDHAYNYEDLAGEFKDVLVAIEDYRKAHRDVDLSSSQIDRLETMSRLQSVYDNVKLTALRKKENPAYELQQISFIKSEGVAKVCYAQLKQLGKNYYHAALTNRSVFNEMQNTLLSEKQFTESLKLESSVKELVQKPESQLQENYSVETVYQEKGSISKLKSKLAAVKLATRIPKKDQTEQHIAEGKEAFTYEESRVLAHLSQKEFPLDSNGKKIMPTAEKLNEYYKAFLGKVKKGEIVVFDSHGKIAQTKDALATLIEKSYHSDGRPDFFLRNDEKQCFEAQSFILTARKADYKINGYQAKPDSDLSFDTFRIYQDVQEELGKLMQDLDAAKSWKHGEAHKAMKKELNGMYGKISKIDVSAGGLKALAGAFSDLKTKAQLYVDSRAVDTSNSKQRERLAVAQRILSLSSVLENPELSYKDYLKNRLAEKARLDKIEIVHLADISDSHSSFMFDNPRNATLKKQNIAYEKELKNTQVHQAKVNDLLTKNAKFAERTEGKSVEELKAMLNEKAGDTVAALDLIPKKAPKTQEKTDELNTAFMNDGPVVK